MSHQTTMQCQYTCSLYVKNLLDNGQFASEMMKQDIYPTSEQEFAKRNFFWTVDFVEPVSNTVITQKWPIWMVIDYGIMISRNAMREIVSAVHQNLDKWTPFLDRSGSLIDVYGNKTQVAVFNGELIVSNSGRLEGTESVRLNSSFHLCGIEFTGDQWRQLESTGRYSLDVALQIISVITSGLQNDHGESLHQIIDALCDGESEEQAA